MKIHSELALEKPVSPALAMPVSGSASFGLLLQRLVNSAVASSSPATQDSTAAQAVPVADFPEFQSTVQKFGR
jgi:hypothetical protein